MGTPPPRAFADAPILEDGYQTNILAAFWKLSTCRSMGMGVGPIPWTAIDSWAIRHGYDSDEIEYETFIFLICEMDSVFLEYVKEENEKETARGKSRSIRKSNPAYRRRRS